MLLEGVCPKTEGVCPGFARGLPRGLPRAFSIVARTILKIECIADNVIRVCFVVYSFSCSFAYCLHRAFPINDEKDIHVSCMLRRVCFSMFRCLRSGSRPHLTQTQSLVILSQRVPKKIASREEEELPRPLYSGRGNALPPKMYC